MKKIVTALLTLLCTLIVCLSIPVKEAHAETNDWTLDNCGVLSEETKEYIRHLNEEVFVNYSLKPQLAIVIVDKIPDGYYGTLYSTAMDQYKLDFFNTWQVGTEEENCGMLFIMAINSHDYGFEIGDGFKEGTLLRRHLEQDFISEDIKALLRTNQYDKAINKVVEHLVGVMDNVENGWYEENEPVYQNYLVMLEEEQKQKEEESAKAAQTALISLGVMGAGIGLVVIVVKIIELVKRSKIRNLLRTRKSFITSMELDKMEHFDYYNDRWADENHMVDWFEMKYSLKELNDKSTLLKALYKYYCEAFYEDKRVDDSEEYEDIYKRNFDDVNTYDAFCSFRMKKLSDILAKCDAEIKEIEEKKTAERAAAQAEETSDDATDDTSEEIIGDYDDYSIDELLDELYDRLSETDTDAAAEYARNALIKALEEIDFYDYCMDVYDENCDEIDDQNPDFDFDSFYRELKKEKKYERYYRREANSDEFRKWIVPLMIMNSAHHHNHHSHSDDSYNSSNTSYTPSSSVSNIGSSGSFGGSFGGGFSSGGGFSGKW